MVVTDADRIDWLEKQMGGNRVYFSRSRVSGLCALHNVSGDRNGSHSVRDEVDRRIMQERRAELGLKP